MTDQVWLIRFENSDQGFLYIIKSTEGQRDCITVISLLAEGSSYWGGTGVSEVSISHLDLRPS